MPRPFAPTQRVSPFFRVSAGLWALAMQREMLQVGATHVD